MYYQDATDAVQQGNSLANIFNAPHAIAYVQGKGWRVYNPVGGCPEGKPELLCIKTGMPPLPLSYDGLDVWMSIIRHAINS